MRTVHFVCPSIWAWRAGRIDQIRRSVDHVLCLFPFEPALLAQHGIAATYVGHPLADVIPAQADRAAARRALGLDEGDEVLAVLPGSRASEIRYLADVFFAAALRVQRARPGLKIIVPALPSLRVAIESAAARAGLGTAGAGGAGGLQILAGQSHQALAACDLTLIASGTATLEAALFKRPMVIAYRMNAISWQIMKRQALQPWVGLPNILLQDMAVPELLQHEATPERLARAVLDWLEAPAKMAAIQQRFAQLHTDLRRDTPTLATDAIAQVLQA
jgi:lipid-A-disaccharide synthase